VQAKQFIRSQYTLLTAWRQTPKLPTWKLSYAPVRAVLARVSPLTKTGRPDDVRYFANLVVGDALNALGRREEALKVLGNIAVDGEGEVAARAYVERARIRWEDYLRVVLLDGSDRASELRDTIRSDLTAAERLGSRASRQRGFLVSAKILNKLLSATTSKDFRQTSRQLIQVRRTKGLRSGEVALLRGQMALLGGAIPESQRLLEEARTYQGCALRASTALALSHLVGFKDTTGSAGIARALEHLGAAVDMSPFDPSPYILFTQVGRVWTRAGWKVTEDLRLEKALASLSRGRGRQRRKRAVVELAYGVVGAMRALQLAYTGESPGGFLERAVGALETARRLNEGSQELWTALAIVYGLRAREHGRAGDRTDSDWKSARGAAQRVTGTNARRLRGLLKKFEDTEWRGRATNPEGTDDASGTGKASDNVPEQAPDEGVR
jgi:hypothetical protein